MVALQKPNGKGHDIAQGEGGEQGDPLMPALHAIAQQPALHDVQAALCEGSCNSSVNVDGHAPAINDVLADSTELRPLASRMP